MFFKTMQSYVLTIYSKILTNPNVKIVSIYTRLTFRFTNTLPNLPPSFQYLANRKSMGIHWQCWMASLYSPISYISVASSPRNVKFAGSYFNDDWNIKRNCHKNCWRTSQGCFTIYKQIWLKVSRELSHIKYMFCSVNYLC